MELYPHSYLSKSSDGPEGPSRGSDRSHSLPFGDMVVSHTKLTPLGAVLRSYYRLQIMVFTPITSVVSRAPLVLLVRRSNTCSSPLHRTLFKASQPCLSVSAAGSFDHRLPFQCAVWWRCRESNPGVAVFLTFSLRCYPASNQIQLSYDHIIRLDAVILLRVVEPVFSELRILRTLLMTILSHRLFPLFDRFRFC